MSFDSRSRTGTRALRVSDELGWSVLRQNVTLSMNELAQAREAVGRLLEALPLDAYVYEVEPREGQWDVRVECAVADGWETCRLTADKEYLLRGE